MADAAPVSKAKVRDAFDKRRDFYAANLETSSLKDIRRDLEKQLALETGALDGVRAFIKELITPLLAECQGDTATARVEQKENTEPEPTNKANKKSSSKPKKEKKEEKKGKKRKEVAPKKEEKPSKKAKKQVDSEEEADSALSSDGERAPKKRAPATSKPAAKRQFSRRVQKLQEIFKQCTLRIGVNVWRLKDDDAIADALEEQLAKYDLTIKSSKGEIAVARAQIEKERDLEGIDMSNIIQDGGGRRARRAAAQVRSYKVVSDLSEEEEEEEEDDGSSSSEADDEVIGDDDVEEKNSSKKGELGPKDAYQVQVSHSQAQTLCFEPASSSNGVDTTPDVQDRHR